MGNKAGKKEAAPATDKKSSKEKPRKSRLASLFGVKKRSADRESGSTKKCKRKGSSKGGGTGSKKRVPKKSLPKQSQARKSSPKKSATKKSLPNQSVTLKSLPRKSMTKKGLPNQSVTLKSLPRKSATKARQSRNKSKNKTPMVVFVIGGPGSGKGTQCEKVVKKYQFTHLSTGDLLRAEVASETERGKQVKAIMERGELVPLETVLTLLKEAIAKVASTSKGFLIDGYPRNVEQGTRFESDVYPVDCVIYFQVSDETMTKRLLKRGETSGRADDNEETIKQRIITFHEETQPVIDYYKKANKVHQIEAEGSVDEIFEKVVAVLDKK